MKYSRKHNHTKAVVLIIIALLGLYVISIKSVPMAYMSASRRLPSIQDLQEQMAKLQETLRTAPNKNVRAMIQAQIEDLKNRIKQRQGSSSVVRPMS